MDLPSRDQLALEYLVELVDSPAFAPRIVATFLQYNHLKVAQGRGQGGGYRFYGVESYSPWMATNGQSIRVMIGRSSPVRRMAAASGQTPA